MDVDDGNFPRLVQSLCALPAETAWVEFKENNHQPETIGDLVSALSNAAALNGQDDAWVGWGVRDGTHEIVGTTFRPEREKVGNLELEAWLVQNLAPRLLISFHSGQVDGKRLVLLRIPAAQDRPTVFKDRELIRIGSTRRQLRDAPDHARELWRRLDRTPFEVRTAAADLAGADVLRLLDHGSFLELLKRPAPTTQAEVLKALEDEALVRMNAAGGWDITNLGAILIARDLSHFPTVQRKTVRLMVYKGRGRTETIREQEGRKGYAIGFAGLIDYLEALLPRNEVIGKALRQEVAMYPQIATRELIANAIIHQDFAISGAGPLVEVFDDRIEITNPGVPLGDIDRLLDQPPRSRNEKLAALMRRMGVCEERGSGVDKIVEATELFQLPPPRWEVSGASCRATLFAHKELREMDSSERTHACYLHASLRREMSDVMTNASLRARFGIEERNSAQASRIINAAMQAGKIKAYDPKQSKRNARYLPYWA